MIGGAGFVSVPLSPSITLSENVATTFLISGIIVTVVGFVLYISHFNDGQKPRRIKRKEKYNSSDWEITAE